MLFQTIGSGLPGVQIATKYDGSPVLRWNGKFVAGLAAHASAEPDTLAIRCSPEDRTAFLTEAPETYYLTDYYQRHPVLLVRLSRIQPEALREVLAMSWRITVAKSRKQPKNRIVPL